MTHIGRPRHQMTSRRRQVLERITEAATRGERISLSRLARECGLYDFRDARRIIIDLKKIGAVN